MVFVLGWFTDQSAWIIDGTFSCPLVSDLQSVCEQAGLTWPKRLVCIDIICQEIEPQWDPLHGTSDRINVVFDQFQISPRRYL